MSDKPTQDILCKVAVSVVKSEAGTECRVRLVSKQRKSLGYRSVDIPGAHVLSPGLCSVCGCSADYPEFRICGSCADWAYDVKKSFALLSFTSLPTGGQKSQGATL